jgi:hypothetical protein
MPPSHPAPPPSDDELDMMLAAGRLGGPARDRIFEAVAREVHPRRRRLGLRTLLSVGLVLGGVTAALVLIPRTGDGGFSAKGGVGAGGASLEISCAGGALNACPVGARLLFAVQGAEGGYLAAWADPTQGGERIWYFSRDSQSPALTPVPGTQVATKAILLGPEHAPGDYVVHVLVTGEPLSRAQLATGTGAVRQRQFALRVVTAR